MKSFFTILVFLTNSGIGYTQIDNLKEIAQNHIKPKTGVIDYPKSYVKTIEEYDSNKLVHNSTSETFYNYDSIKFFFQA